jgi:PmbA protein
LELKKYENIAENLVSKSQDLGAQESEVYIIGSQDLSVEVSQGDLETMKTAESYGVGIRVIKEHKMGYSFTSDFSDDSLQEMVKSAIESSNNVSDDEGYALPEKNKKYEEIMIYDPLISKTPVEQKIEIAMDIENYAKKYDKRIKITESCTYQDSNYNVIITNSKGLKGSYKASYCGAHAFLVAEENGDNQTGFSLQYGLDFEKVDPKSIGEEAAQKAVRMLGAQNISTQKAAIILEPYVASNFLEVTAPSLTAEAVQKGKSLFANKMGQDIAASELNIIDDGHKKGAIISSPFDGEGVSTQKTILVENGILKSYLHNTYTAKKDGVSSTGNAKRGSYKSTPEVGTTNFYIDKGNITKDELIKNVEKGFYITEVMGMHTANPISGDFSVGASGIWIENGEFTKPVRGVAIAGNIKELLKSVEAVADDLTFFIGIGSPTLRIAKMTVSGS